VMAAQQSPARTYAACTPKSRQLSETRAGWASLNCPSAVLRGQLPRRGDADGHPFLRRNSAGRRPLRYRPIRGSSPLRPNRGNPLAHGLRPDFGVRLAHLITLETFETEDPYRDAGCCIDARDTG
jgi:hypothetical protein